MAERVPPHSVEAEMAVLGAMLLESGAADQAFEMLCAEDFYSHQHQVIFTAMTKLYRGKKPVDIVTLTAQLKDDGNLDGIGGIPYLTAVSDAVTTAANLAYYAKIVEEKSLLRQLIRAATEAARLGYEAGDDVSEIIDRSEQLILRVAEKRKSQEFVPTIEIMMRAFERLETLHASQGKVTGIATGFTDFDRLLSGLQPSDLIILAARPSMGKTALALNIAQHAAVRGKKAVAIFSLEMSKEQLAQRMLCAEAGIDSQRLRSGMMQDEDWQKLVAAADRLSQSPIFIDDTGGIGVMEMRAKARRLKAAKGKGLDLIIVDYLQLMQGSAGRGEINRQEQIAEISRSLKGLARELDVPVLALSQLSRQVEHRTNKRPMLSDLRESGALEQDADIVMFLYRDDYYNPETENKDITELIIAKHRNGPTDVVKLFFQKPTTRFRNISPMQG
ncbi:MAG: replicative DNA helicase [Negativicutes bacterium]|nr:replicative DNA helicase [Negativicutes bacterium]